MTDWSDYQDDISDAISESVDIDWNANDGARAVVRWLNENVSLTASANDALALRTMLDNLVIAQGLSKEIREHATDAARSYLYNTRAMLSAAPAPEGGAVEDLREALIQADLKIRSLPGTDQSDVEFIRAALATREEAPAKAGEPKYFAAFMAEDGTLRAQPPAREDYSSLIVARCLALPGKLIDCPVCGAVDNERSRQAREDAQPVAWRYRFVTSTDGKEWSDWFLVDGRTYIPTRENQTIQPLYTHPAPDALRVALQKIANLRGTIMDGEAVDIALAALQAEQGAK